MFSEDFKRVALIRKTRPEWQVGKLNGPGGKIEKVKWSSRQESPHVAMVREFQEETGVFTDILRWHMFCWLSGNNGNYHGEPGEQEKEPFTVFFFKAKGKLSPLKSVTDEKLEIIEVADLAKHNTVSNCQWLIPMALTMNSTPVSFYAIDENYKR